MQSHDVNKLRIFSQSGGLVNSCDSEASWCSEYGLNIYSQAVLPDNVAIWCVSYVLSHIRYSRLQDFWSSNVCGLQWWSYISIST